jgi:hypothetical protein
MHQHNFGLADLDNMIPWEREIYISLVENHVRKENERMKKQNG